MSTLATYDLDRGRLAFYFDSYWGGDRYRAPSSPSMGRATLTRWYPVRDSEGRESGDYEERTILSMWSYLVPHPGEPPRSFNVRVSLASYVNLCQPIVDAYTDAVTAPVVRDLGALDPYLQRLDGRALTWAEHVEEVARWCCTYGYCASVIDAPESNPATSRADEQRLGVGLRATLIHPTALAWVMVGDDGHLEELAFADAPYLQQDTGRQRVRMWVYTRETWALYETEIVTTSGYGTMRPLLADLTPVRSGPLARPGRVPVAFAYFRRDTSSPTPRGVPLIGDAADLCRQIYNALSCCEEIHRKTAFPFLAIPEPSQGGQLDPSTRVQVGPDTAFGYSSATGVPQWVQPSAESTKELREHSVFLAQLALRTTGLEVSSSDTSPDASGEALKVRSRDFDARCARFARSLAAYEHEALSIAGDLLSLDAGQVAITYPKRFTLPDPSSDLARVLLLVNSFGAALGPKGSEAAIRAALDAALSLSDEQLAGILAALPSAQTAATTATDAAQVPA